MILEIPRVPPSPNDLLGYHWRHRQRNQKVWGDEVVIALINGGYVGHRIPYERAKVIIDRRSRGQLDPDNLVGCVKPILDGLRRANVLKDDTPKHIELVVTQTRSRTLPPRLRIEVQPLQQL